MKETDFLKKKYWPIPEFRKAAGKAAKRQKKREGGPIPSEPDKQIEVYLERFNQIIKNPDQRRRARGIEALKRLLHQRLIIKPENIPDDYFTNLLLGNYAEAKGYSSDDLKDPETRKELVQMAKRESISLEMPEREKEEQTQGIIQDQQASLDVWLDYFTSPSVQYPDWFKYWTFAEITKLGNYEPEKKRFSKRDKKTVALFPQLNPGALALILDALEKKYQGQGLDLDQLEAREKQEFEKLLEKERFGQLYAWALEKIARDEVPEELLKITQGQWRLYKQGSDPQRLVRDIRKYTPDWCIRGKSTAANYLKRSDIWIYYSNDQKGQPTIPRTAIVLRENQILEVRGRARNQNLDPYISDVLNDKLKELPGGQEYAQSIVDMKKLTRIWQKQKRGEGLTREELRFIYEIDRPIENRFALTRGRDPRIRQIIKGRETRTDLVKALETTPDKISLTKEEALKGGVIFHYGNLDLGSVESPEGLELPQQIRGNLDLRSVNSPEGLKLPERIEGYLDLNSLPSAKGLRFPKYIGKDLFLGSLNSPEGLELPEHLGGSLDLNGLLSAEGLELPQQIRGSLDLRSVNSPEGLKLPERVEGSLDLNGLLSAKGLKLPKYIGWNLGLGSVESPEGLELPEHVGGSLDLNGLLSAKGLRFSKYIGYNIWLGSLNSTEGLELPEHVGGSLHLEGLSSIKGLRLPKEVEEYIHLGPIPQAEREELIKKYPQHKDKMIFHSETA